jgi:hypothetical protein
VRDTIDGYTIVCIELPSEAVSEEEGFGACLIGREGAFAGSFVIRTMRTGFQIKGRWYSPSGTWYAFEKPVQGKEPIAALEAFGRRVVGQREDFDSDEFGVTSRREPSTKKTDDK